MTQGKSHLLEGKNIIVTGSSMGIGQAVAITLAEEGANVVLNARGQQGLSETMALMPANRIGKVVSYCGSVADYALAGQLVESCMDHFGHIDGLINCAGIAEPQGSSILDIAVEDWQELINVHLHGTFNTCRHAAPLMKQQGHGSIINTSSHAFMGMYGGTGYAAGKGGTNSLSLALSMDLKEHGINVNVICPGAKTRLSTGEDYENLIGDLNRRGLLDDSLMEASLNPPDPSYVAPLYAYLASSHAKEITGRIFWAAGGYIGLFHRNPDQLLAFKDHETSPPWKMQELITKLHRKDLQKIEETCNVILSTNNCRLLVKQKLLLKIANAAPVQWLMRLKN
ncbi:MAG: SDR family oxidoreductase [Pseudomonadales bacterium]|nr:SDR family oxidoreductase [Pseudomonadales bacterium]